MQTRDKVEVGGGSTALPFTISCFGIIMVKQSQQHISHLRVRACND